MVIKYKIKHSGVLEKGFLVEAITPGTNYRIMYHVCNQCPKNGRKKKNRAQDFPLSCVAAKD